MQFVPSRAICPIERSRDALQLLVKYLSLYKVSPMDLFTQFSENPSNLLPKDGTALYYGTIFVRDTSDRYFETLKNTIAWKHDEVRMFGKHIVTKRKVAWYASSALSYTYANQTKTALPFTEALVALKKEVETTTKATYNSCLLNLYHNGTEGMSWHTDNEKELQPNGAIASLSFGAERKFAFKHRETKEVVSLVLQHGSLLLMKDTIQQHWLHRLPPTKKVQQPRINLTFRTIVS